MQRANGGQPYDCPATGFKEKCREAGCPEWVHITGKHPQNNSDVDMFDCARQWIPVLLIHVAKEANANGAAILDLRNEIAKGDLANVSAVSELVAQLTGALEQRHRTIDAPRPGLLARMLRR